MFNIEAKIKTCSTAICKFINIISPFSVNDKSTIIDIACLDFLFDTTIGVTSSGLQLGYKLPIGKRFAVDFLIAGPGTARYSFDVVNKSDELPDEFWEDLNEALEKLGIYELIDSDFDFQPSDRSSAFNTVNFRYAVSLTYNF